MRPNGITQGRFALLFACGVPAIASMQGHPQAGWYAALVAALLATMAFVLTCQGRWGWRALWWHATAALPFLCIGMLAAFFFPIPSYTNIATIGTATCIGGTFGLMAIISAPMVGHALWPKTPDAEATLAAVLAAYGAVSPGTNQGGSEKRWTVATSRNGAGLTLGHDPARRDGRAAWPRPWKAVPNEDPQAVAALRAFHDAFEGYSWPAAWIAHGANPMMFATLIAIHQDIIDDARGKPTHLWLPAAPTSAHQRLSLLGRVHTHKAS